MNLYKVGIAAFLLLGAVMLFGFLKKTPSVTAEVQDEVVNQPLPVSGQIPNWLSGTLVRNGPVNVSVNGKSNSHWFDGLAMLHAFSFADGAVRYSNKFLRTDAYQKVFEEGSICYEGFAADPCRSVFKDFLTYFIPHTEVQNANINVAKIADTYFALTEVPLPVKFDRETLDTLGVFNYEDQLPKDRCWESAHPHHDGKLWNYLINFGRKSHYVLYCIEKGQLERKVIAEVEVEQPSYMHSFSVTENYIILTEYPFVVQPYDLIVGKKAFIKNFKWEPERGTRFVVVNKKDGKVQGTYVTRPFFSFHHGNAFEKEGKIYFDIVTYDDALIITGESFYFNDATEEPAYRLERFVLSLDTGAITSSVVLAEPNEFPRINEKYDGKPYSFLYSVGFEDKIKRNPLSCKLYKTNTTTRQVVVWQEEGCYPGEPVFVEAPGARAEDDGVVLAVVTHANEGNSFLLVLDAKTFKELGRATAPHLIPSGLHGQYFK